MTFDQVRRPGRSAGFLVVGAILLALAVLGIVLYATGAPDALPAGSPETGYLRAATVIGAAACAGTGAALLVIGGIKHRRRHRTEPDKRS